MKRKGEKEESKGGKGIIILPKMEELGLWPQTPRTH